LFSDRNSSKPTNVLHTGLNRATAESADRGLGRGAARRGAKAGQGQRHRGPALRLCDRTHPAGGVWGAAIAGRNAGLRPGDPSVGGAQGPAGRRG